MSFLNKKIPVITIDGPAASGKGIIASEIAKVLGWGVLNSGIIYRTVAFQVLKMHISLADINKIISIIKDLEILDLYKKYIESKHHDETLSEKIGNCASYIAQNPKIRSVLLENQRSFKKNPGLVADGRDMGTIVFPEADLKVFLTADFNVRINRRKAQLIEKNISVNLENLCSNLKERDLRDSLRSNCPLVADAEAYILDSSNLSIGETVDSILNLWKKCSIPVSMKN